jgi:uncharacterized protein
MQSALCTSLRKIGVTAGVPDPAFPVSNPSFSLTLCSAAPTIARSMSATFPETVDAWRMVQARRQFEGSIPLVAMPRLRGSLVATDGAADFQIEFGKDDFGVAHLRAHIEAGLPLTCQRTLETFVLPVRIDAQLGLITREEDEAGLPAGYEPLLTSDGTVRLADVIEDELILALPVVPVKPGSAPAAHQEGARAIPESAQPRPFEVLKKLKAAKR